MTVDDAAQILKLNPRQTDRRPATGAFGGESPERCAAPPLIVLRGPRGQLGRGPRLPREVVEADQRRRLIGAVLAVAAARGYTATSAKEVSWRAGVSTRTLFLQFDGLHDLLLTACEEGLDCVLGGVEEATRSEPGSDGVREGLRCLLERFAAEPELTRCCLFELCALGPDGKQCRQRALERLAVALGLAGIDTRSGGAVGIAGKLAAGGVWHAVEVHVLDDRASSLMSLLPVLDRYIFDIEHGYRAAQNGARRCTAVI